MLISEPRDPFTHVILRHGTAPLSAYDALPEVKKLLPSGFSRTIGVDPRYPPDYFGAPSTVYRGAAGPSAEDYLDELRGNGFLIPTASGLRIPLSRFSDVAVELLAERPDFDDVAPARLPDNGSEQLAAPPDVADRDEAKARYTGRLWDRRIGISILPDAILSQLQGFAFIRGEAGRQLYLSTQFTQQSGHSKPCQ